MRAITVMADNGINFYDDDHLPIWEGSTYTEDIIVSPNLKQSLTTWNNWYEKFDCHEPITLAFVQEGRKLAATVKEELGDSFEVWFYNDMSDTRELIKEHCSVNFDGEAFSCKEVERSSSLRRSSKRGNDMLEFDNIENITHKDVDAMFEDIVMAIADGYNFLMLKRLLYQLVESDSEKANDRKLMLYQFYKLCHISLNDRA